MGNVLKSGTQILPCEDDSVRASTTTWQEHLKIAVRTLDELLRRIELDRNALGCERAGLAEQDFPLFVPIPWLQRIRSGDANDPLLAQVLATAAERITAKGFVDDPLDESGFQPIPGVLHKYEGRVLLVVAGVCAINCRYCFRRHFPYDTAPRTKEQLSAAFDYLRDHPEVDEVLLSGGDPLMLSDERLEWIVGQLDEIPTLKRLRIHTRMPVANSKVAGRKSLPGCIRELEQAATTFNSANVSSCRAVRFHGAVARQEPNSTKMMTILRDCSRLKFYS